MKKLIFLLLKASKMTNPHDSNIPPSAIVDFSVAEEFLLNLQLRYVKNGSFTLQDIDELKHLLTPLGSIPDFNDPFLMLLLSKTVVAHVYLLQSSFPKDEEAISYLENRIYYFLHCQSDPSVYQSNES